LKEVGDAMNDHSAGDAEQRRHAERGD